VQDNGDGWEQCGDGVSRKATRSLILHLLTSMLNCKRGGREDECEPTNHESILIFADIVAESPSDADREPDQVSVP
jgi:hypothetical protein